MPSLAQVADRLGSLPSPKGFSPEAFGFFKALWALYPSCSEPWTQVIPVEIRERADPQRPRSGDPLLGIEDIRFDAPPILLLWERMARLMEPLEGARMDPSASSRAFFASGPDAADPEVLIGGCLLRPFLYRAAQEASRLIETDGWTGEICPVCGGSAYHGLIEGDTRKRVLACGKCHFMWSFPRIRCPFCDNSDQALLGFYCDEEEPRVRIDFCRACNRLLPVTVQEEGSGFPLIVYDHLVANDLLRRIQRRGS
jgi:RNA polymerase subunit RPABC4/transcription elongation factor Spt4